MSKSFIDISEELFDLLENNYIAYYNTLCDLELQFDKLTIKKIIDNSVYRTYFGNQLHALIYLTGDLENAHSEKYNIYGATTVIPDKFAIKIFNKLLEYNIDIYQKNYYKQTPLQNINCNSCYSYRVNNIKLKNIIKNKYISNLNLSLIK